MKNQLTMLLSSAVSAVFISIFLINNIYAQSEWTQKDRDKYHEVIKIEFEGELEKLTNTEDETLNITSRLVLKNIDHFCDCGVRKLETAYPKRKEFLDLKGEAKINNFQKIIKSIESECSIEAFNINQEGTRKLFLHSCITGISNSEKESIKPEVAEQFCECVINKYFEREKNFNKIIGKTGEEVADAMQVEASECSKLLNTNNSISNEITPSDATEVNVKWTPALENEFIKACTAKSENPNQQKFCKCVIDKIKTKYPNFSDFAKIAGNQERLISELQDELTDCN